MPQRHPIFSSGAHLTNNISLTVSRTSTIKNNLDIRLDDDPQEVHHRNVEAKVLFVCFGLGILFNVPISVLLLTKRYFHKQFFGNIDLLILHLSIADSLVAIFCGLADAIWKLTYQWLAGNFTCKAVKFMQMLSLYASTFIITAINIDRCMVISRPLTRVRQHAFVKIMLLGGWLLAVICSTPQLQIFRVEKAPFQVDGHDLWQCCTHGAYSEPWQETAYTMATFAVIFAIPLGVILVSYSIIWCHLRRNTSYLMTPEATMHRRRGSSRARADSVRELTMRRAARNAFWISLLVILTFIACWAPYHIAMIYFVFAHGADVNGAVSNAVENIFLFGMSNSIANPVIYGAFHLFRNSNRH
ncbi:putative Gonadotropin-releasing hormone receptor [Hypsibius exemplaris]|uniref:Gonadotropin-releasing hormone receptor n=1 Tax=Hypsibius exemplaris TaxID=2072580 RepID=A0A1W0XBF7_HYPEX|nr:putative Gonadotropin-releasing hormone receptor [Hypsibius exemplaris]